MFEEQQVNEGINDKSITEQEQKLLSSCLAPFKLSKEIKQFVRKINLQGTASFQVIPANLTMRLPKNTFKDVCIMHVILLMIMKKQALGLQFKNQSTSKKHIIQSKYVVNYQNKIPIKNQLIEYINLNISNRGHTIKLLSLSMEFESQIEMYCVHFVNNLLYYLSLFNIKIAELRIAKTYKSNNITEDYIKLYQKLSQLINNSIIDNKVEILSLNGQFMFNIVKQLNTENKILQNLYSLHLKNGNLHCSSLVSCLINLPRLCSLKVAPQNLEDPNQQYLKKMIIDILPQHNTLIQSIKMNKQYLPESITSAQLKRLAYECPYLGQLDLKRREDEIQKQQKQKFFKMIIGRRISIQHYMNIIKIMDKGQHFDYQTVLSVLDCCSYFIF